VEKPRQSDNESKESISFNVLGRSKRRTKRDGQQRGYASFHSGWTTSSVTPKRWWYIENRYLFVNFTPTPIIQWHHSGLRGLTARSSSLECFWRYVTKALKFISS